jgi:hypothetical protein
MCEEENEKKVSGLKHIASAIGFVSLLAGTIYLEMNSHKTDGL